MILNSNSKYAIIKQKIMRNKFKVINNNAMSRSKPLPMSMTKRNLQEIILIKVK